MVSLTASQVVLPDQVLAPGVIDVDDHGRIAAIEPTTGPVVARTLVPGLVDLQVNGHDDVDVGHADGADWDRLDHLLAAQGVTAWCPTIVTAPLSASTDLRSGACCISPTMSRTELRRVKRNR